MSQLIATVFYIGYLRPAPGTWGSFVALPIAWVIIQLSGFLGLVIAALIIFTLGIWATKVETAGRDNHDPSEIVIDEVVGQWVALFPVAYGAGMMRVDVLALWPGWIMAFVLFRLFDITKPWLVGWADRRDDVLGVMLDDVIAGIFTGICVIILAGVYHGIAM